MCGRFAFYSPAQAAVELFGVSQTITFDPRYNLAPTQDLLGIRRSDEGNNEAALFRWGLIPFWAKDKAIGNRMINARSETVAEKPAYRAAYKHRRCLLLADGFYEWKKTADGKVPHFISLASGETFSFGGLWERWTDKETGEIVESATIITTEANEFMAPIHNRMPLLLTPETAPEWLDGGDGTLSHIRDITPELTAWPVSKRVNNPRHEGEDLVNRLQDK